MKTAKNKRGFSLIEALIAILLVGLSIASLMAANSAFTKANGDGTDLSTAEFLFEQIRELTTPLPVIDPETELDVFGPEAGETIANYDDLDDFDGANFSPPINAFRSTLSDFAEYTQQVTVENVNPSDFEQVVADHGSCFVRITVRISKNSRQVCSASWLRARY